MNQEKHIDDHEAIDLQIYNGDNIQIAKSHNKCSWTSGPRE